MLYTLRIHRRMHLEIFIPHFISNELLDAIVSESFISSQFVHSWHNFSEL